MSVSVIVPCHNQSQYLAESLESVLAQSVKPFQVVVVDDGSADNTAEVCKSFDVDYIYQEHRGNHTPARAMNTGLCRSKGDFVVCLAADDKIAPDYLEKCLARFTKPEVGVVFTGCQEFGASDKLRVPRTLHHRFSVFREPHGQIGAMMVRREVYFGARDCASYYGYFEASLKFPESVGGYDASLHSLEDWDLLIRAGLNGWKIRSIKEPLHFARIHDGRVTTHADASELWRKYPMMRGYALISRGFDAAALAISQPHVLLPRLHRKAFTVMENKRDVKN